jgi:hypothetical protein
VSRLESIESEYRLLQLEAEFSEKKARGILTDEDRRNLRAVREAYRLHHRLPTPEGAAPAVLGTKSKWQRIMEVLAD